MLLSSGTVAFRPAHRCVLQEIVPSRPADAATEAMVVTLKGPRLRMGGALQSSITGDPREVGAYRAQR